jgi:hypothetical protein
VPEAFFGLAEFIVQVGDVLATLVLQFHPLQIVPDLLSWVQPWGIAGGTAPSESSGLHPQPDIPLHCLTAVELPPFLPGIPDIPI